MTVEEAVARLVLELEGDVLVANDRAQHIRTVQRLELAKYVVELLTTPVEEDGAANG